MTVGTVSNTVELVGGASTSIKPSGANDEWIIHNIYLTNGGSFDIEFGDGTNWVMIDNFTRSWTGMYSHVTYTDYMRVTNGATTTAYVAYDGVSIV